MVVVVVVMVTVLLFGKEVDNAVEASVAMLGFFELVNPAPPASWVWWVFEEKKNAALTACQTYGGGGGWSAP